MNHLQEEGRQPPPGGKAGENAETDSGNRTPLRRRPGIRAAYWTLVVLFVAALLPYIAVKAVFAIHGRISLTPVLFHLTAGGESGLSWDMVKLFAPWVLAYLFWAAASVFVAWLFWCFDTVSGALRWLGSLAARLPGAKALDRRPMLIAVPLLLALPAYWSSSVDRKLHIIEFFSRPESPWIEKHFARLDLEASGRGLAEKPNLIVLFLESMEEGFADERAMGENLIPELQALRREGVSFSGYRRTPGSAFTMDGMSAQLLGIPLVGSRLGLDIHNVDMMARGYGALLRNAPSIFSLLERRGWRTAAFTGASEKFTMKGDFFRIHGIREIYSRERFGQMGFREEGAARGLWGYNDEFLYARFKDWLGEAGAGGRPFAAVMETVDTHSPDGFVPAAAAQRGDARDAFRRSAQLAADFIAWAKMQPWYSKTVIYVAGDHPWQDGEKLKFTRFTKKLREREIFNVILNARAKSVRPGEPAAVPGGWCAMDMAPTLLDAMGVPFESFFSDGSRSRLHLGLGASLFAAAAKPAAVRTWVSAEGEEAFRRELERPSRFYDSLF